MLNKYMKVFTGAVLVAAIMSLSAAAYAESGSPIRKLARGVANMATGILEVPINIVDVTEEEGYVAGLTYGIIKGVAMAVLRLGVGVYETATFPIPLPLRYEKILEPEFLMSDVI